MHLIKIYPTTASICGSQSPGNRFFFNGNCFFPNQNFRKTEQNNCCDIFDFQSFDFSNAWQYSGERLSFSSFLS